MGRRMFGYAIFYGLGVGSAIFALALVLPVLHHGSPLAIAGSTVTQAQVHGDATMCPYLASRGDAPHAVIPGVGSSSACPYLDGGASSCPYLREHPQERAGSGMAPTDPRLRASQGDDWPGGAERPQAVALLQVEHPSGNELASAGWF